MANPFDLACAGASKLSSTGLVNALAVSVVQSVLYGLDGRNTDTSNAVYIMLFDTATAPANGADPITIIGVGAAKTDGTGNFFYSLPPSGIQFNNGIYIGVSTTDATYTASATSKTKIHVQFALEAGA